jgi:hypothetical protein
MAGHTPGPWHVAKGGLGREIRADDGPFIASVYDSTFTYGERNANARLLAAAPDLLDACQAFVAALDNTKFDVFIGSPAELLRLADARRAALAAIAKTAGT